MLGDDHRRSKPFLARMQHTETYFVDMVAGNIKENTLSLAHFFLPPPLSPSSFFSQDTTFPSMTTPLPSMKATRESPSQFLKVSQTSGCCGWKAHSAISFDFKECGSSIFLPPVSFPIFHFNLEMRQAERPQRTKPIEE